MNRDQSRTSSINNNNASKMSSVIRAKNFDVSKVVHDKIKPKGKGKMVKMNTGGSMIRLQLPIAKVPFGLSTYEDDKTGIKKYSMEISLGGSTELEEFREQLADLDDLNVNIIVSNCKAWIGEDKTKEVVEGALYGSLIKPDKKGESPPRFKMKLPVWEGKPMFTVYGNDKKQINTYDLVDGVPVLNWDWAQNGMEIKVIVECEGLWVVNKNIYCTWRAVSIKVTKKSNRITEYSFEDDDEDDDKGSDGSDGSEVDDEDEGSEVDESDNN